MKSIKYILKRVIVGVLIALIMFLLKKNLFISNVYAAVVSHQGTSINTTFSNVNTDYAYTVSPQAFSGRGPGTVNFSVALYKVGGDPTSPLVMIRSVNLHNPTGYFSCSIGSTSLTNSTFGGTVYSISCPVDFTEGGITQVKFFFMDNQQNSNSTFRFQFNGLFTYSSNQDINIDTSGTTNAVNNQITNDNSNTNKIVDAQEETTQAVEENTQAVEENTQAVNDVKDTINDDNVTGATSEGSSFFDGFTTNDHGLSGIITSPLRLLDSLSTATCSPLSFQLPFTHDNVSLQCPRPILENHFGVFFSLWQLITTGLISYHVCINIYSKIRDLQNPENDRIEVLNL